MFSARYVGRSLANSLVPRSAEALTRRTSRNIAARAQDVLLETAKAATPSRTSALRDGWLKEPIEGPIATPR